MAKKNLNAFTQIELLIVVLLIALLAVLSVPSYLNFIEGNEIESSANQLAADINFARMESIRRGTAVAVCAAQTEDQTSCGSGTNWSNGWIVFLDVNNDGQIVNPSTNILQVSDELANTLTVTANTGLIHYDASGYLTSTPLNLLINSQNCTGTSARTLTIPASGQLSIAPTTC